MKPVILGAVVFFLPPTAIALLFTLASLCGRTGRSTLDDFILPAYLILYVMICATAGFVMVTAVAPAWRRLSAWRAMLIAGPIGLTCPVFYMLGMTVSALGLLRLFRSVPWLAAVLTYLTPGVMMGLVAVGIAAVISRRSPKTEVSV